LREIRKQQRGGEGTIKLVEKLRSLQLRFSVLANGDVNNDLISLHIHNSYDRF